MDKAEEVFYVVFPSGDRVPIARRLYGDASALVALPSGDVPLTTRH